MSPEQIKAAVERAAAGAQQSGPDQKTVAAAFQRAEAGVARGQQEAEARQAASEAVALLKSMSNPSEHEKGKELFMKELARLWIRLGEHAQKCWHREDRVERGVAQNDLDIFAKYLAELSDWVMRMLPYKDQFSPEELKESCVFGLDLDVKYPFKPPYFNNLDTTNIVKIDIADFNRLREQLLRRD